MSEFQEFLKDNNFKFLESKFDNRVEIYSSEYLILRIVQDGNLFKSVEVSSRQDANDWFSLNIIRSLVLKNEDYLKVLDFEVACFFLVEYYSVVLDLFSAKNYSLTIKLLKKLEDKRAEIKYGKFRS